MVVADRPVPWLRTVALKVKEAPAAGLLVVTVGASTRRSGAGAAPTVRVTAGEQLFPVLLSPLTLSTQAP